MRVNGEGKTSQYTLKAADDDAVGIAGGGMSMPHVHKLH